jgi:acyl carrier protein
MTLLLAEPASSTFETAREQELCAADVKTPLRETILARFRTVAAAQGRAIAELTDDLVLLESGLDSLCFAIIVATLEDELGYDPFTEAEDVYFPVTLGDFVRFYQRGV